MTTDVRLRAAVAEDFTFLATMLGEAAVWRPDKPTPTADHVLADPRYACYLAGWPRHGDSSVADGHPAISLSVAERNPARRLYESTGFVPVATHGSTWTTIRHAARSS
ncbi:MAG TPA: hypothetical protein VFC33_11160 [Acidimicrobiia bacterium]|nr:hypothetical protein [Acidimicrobiia bacterium]